MNKLDITYLYKNDIFNEIDIHFAGFITRLSDTSDTDIFLAAALVSNATGNGHVCIDLKEAPEAVLAGKPDLIPAAISPSQPICTDKLLRAPVVGRPGDFCPLILDEKNRLYLYRYWEYERKLADAILQRVTGGIERVDLNLLGKSLERLFPDHLSAGGVNWQAAAAAIAVCKRFCVISGGPGTGKTFTIAAILALLLEQGLVRPHRVFLCAPTGKASAKLKESILQAKARLDCVDSVKDAIPEDTYTIHRLLKTIPGSPFFQYTADKPLPADLVVVDEASMVDLALMSKLFDALPSGCRVVLVGDKDQLASVEAGSVLGDICDRDARRCYSHEFAQTMDSVTGIRLNEASPVSGEISGLQDGIVTLRKSYRFDDNSGIGALSRAVNTGAADDAVGIFHRSATDPQISWEEAGTEKEFYQALEQHTIEGYSAYLRADRPKEALEKFARFRILCTVNKGPYGVDAINLFVEGVLRRKGLIEPDMPWYGGRPVFVSKNDYSLGLFNGDIGVLMADYGSDRPQTYAFFPGASDEVRRFMPQRIRDSETAYAMTVHKCQGSEFDHVLFILPDKAYPVLTRELIYTGVTRAKKTVTLLGPETIFRTAVNRTIGRTSGLRDALWGNKP
jgi:exodeoxyribonuclease V alpha subunit